jgi:transposase InsO family protein
MQDQDRRSYLFVRILPNKTAASAKAFLQALHKACPIKITKMLTDNGKEFTDRLFASREREPTGEHEFDKLCAALGIEHRLIRPAHPQTNVMVERFNGRISDVLATNGFDSAQSMNQTLLRYVKLYNTQLPQTALESKTPHQALKDWFASHPHLFHRRPVNQPGCDTYRL